MLKTAKNFLRRFVRIHLSTGHEGRFSWDLTVYFGKGAGYKGGATAYIGWRCRGGSAWKGSKLLTAGLTRNGNATVWPSDSNWKTYKVL